ncbi:MAG: DUF3800 domain-containing protein [Methylocella sp.]
MPPAGYIAYIDEAGDDGLRTLKTKTPNGASEWMVLSAVLIKAERETDTVRWVKDIITKINQHQITNIHFQKLKDDKRMIASEELAKLNVRIFSVISHKQNMIGYRNARAEQAKINKTTWFYCWLSRILLERITVYCGNRSKKDYGQPRFVKFEFSDRGGVKIEDIRDYYRYLHSQSRIGSLFHSAFDLDWSVFEHDELYSYPNKMRAGLQLADIAASAFFAGLERAPDGTTRSEFAKQLLPRVCRNHQRRVFGFGVKVWSVWLDQLPPEQRSLIDFYRSK